MKKKKEKRKPIVALIKFKKKTIKNFKEKTNKQTEKYRINNKNK